MGAARLLEFAQGDCRFKPRATVCKDLTWDGDFLRGDTLDPRIELRPVKSVRAGWCRFVMRAEGALARPRVYFDFGAGFFEPWSTFLKWHERQKAWRAVAWLPAPLVGVRLDPSESPCRMRLEAFEVDPIAPGDLAQVLSYPDFAAPARPRTRLRAALEHIAGSPSADDINCRVLFSERSHLTGVSLDFAKIEPRIEAIELRVFDQGDMRLVRKVPVDFRNADRHNEQHIYWEPVEDSAQRFFVVRAIVAPDAESALLSPLTMIREATPVHGDPEPLFDLPNAITFSPVAQCNLNCVHCISQPSRTKFATASDRVWEEVAQAARQPGFTNISSDYSGDILFDEVKHGGLLSRLIALGTRLRIDTNANCLDEDIAAKLLASRLFEINFSLDSMDPEVYAKVRKGSIPLPEVLAKIARFMELKRAAGHRARTLMSFLLMRSTAPTIKPALAFAKQHGIDFVSVHQMIAFTPDMLEEIVITDDAAYAAIYHELMEEAQRLGVSLVMQPPVERWDDRDGHAPCDVPWGTALITGNGDVMACCVPGTRLGNLNEQSLHDIWHGPEYRAFRLRVNSPDPPAPCRNCAMIPIRNNPRAFAPARYAPQPVRWTRKTKRPDGA